MTNSNEIQNLPDSVVESANVIDTAVDALRGGEATPPYLKLGNLTTAIDVGIYAKRGEPENIAQALGVTASQGLVAATGGAIVLALVPGMLGVVLAGGLVWGAGYTLDHIIDKLQGESEDSKKDPNNPTDPSAKTYRIEYYDPLILDLNGDGVISTKGQEKYEGVLFDHDGDGIKTATGWINAEDGFLVQDLNNNGIIDNGSELFGDSTILSNGDLAKNGFEALSEYDSNGDKIIDQNDIKYSQLKIWKDLNGDGVSTADELFKLEQLGITSLKVDNVKIANQNQEGGVVAETSTYTTSDGKQQLLADINFEKNSAYSEFVEKIIISEEVKSLPNILGFGRLQNLHEAAMKSEELKNLLSQYDNTTSRSQQKELIDALIFAWAKTDTLYNNDTIDIIKFENLTWTMSSDSTNVIYLTPRQSAPSYLFEPAKDPEVADSELTQKIRFVDAILGNSPTKKLNQIDQNQIGEFENQYNSLVEGIYKELLNKTILKEYLDSIDIYIQLEGGDNLIIDYQQLQDLLDVNFSIDPLGAFEDLKDLISLNNNLFREFEWDYGFALFSKWYSQLIDNPVYSGSLDEILSSFNELDVGYKNQIIQIKNNEDMDKKLDFGDDTIIITKETGASVNAGQGNDLIVLGGGDDFVNGGDGNNKYIILSGSGNDFIAYDNIGQGQDKIHLLDIFFVDTVFAKKDQNLVLKFSDSNSLTIIGALDEFSTKSLIFKFKDNLLTLEEILQSPLNNITDENTKYINGWRGIDYLLGNSDDNLLYAFDGNDTLVGGSGNDRLYGGNGQDTYVFQSGDGIDEIYETDFAIEQNTIVFNDINSIDISKATFEASDLIIQYGIDKIILKNYIQNSQNSDLRIQFADQTIWQNNDLMARVTFEGSDNNENIVGVLNDRVNIINSYGGDDFVQGNVIAVNSIDGGAGNDEIYGGQNADTIQGGAGDDFIYALAGNDEINGGDGNDTLFGGEGDDLIIGGDGNDWLQGDGGTDILRGGLGDDSYDVDDLDTIIENPDEGYDTIFIENDFDLSGTDLEAIRLKGNGDFRAIGDEKDNELYGNAGNNYLDGKAGADIISGGAGDDYYVVDQYDKLITNQDGSTTLIRGDQIVEGILNPSGYVFGDSGGIDTVEQWDDHRFYSQDMNGNWFDTGSYHLLQSNVENLILRGQAKVGFGNELDNIIIGNDQDNFIDGQGGNDTYIYTKGGGTDTFNFEDINSATNILRIEGHDVSQMYGQKFGDSVLLGFKNSTDKIWLLNYALNDYLDNDGNTITYKFDEIRFDSGTVLTTFDVDALVTRAENNQAPVVDQYPSTLNVKIDEVLQYTFNNVISDPDLDDQLSYTLTMQTQDSNGDYQTIPDWVVFDPETLTVTISPQEGIDVGQLSFYLWGTDLYGVGTGVGVNINIQPSASTPIPGAIYDTAGNDILIGGTEDNIFFYTGGRDTIQEAGGVDILRFSNGITFNEVGSGLTKSGNDLILKVNGSSANQVTLKNYFLAGDNLVETIDFETGGQLTAEQLFNAFGLTLPSSGGDTGSGSSDPVGDTTYNYASGDLTITEVSGTDKVVFASSINFSQIGNYMTMSGNDLILKVNGSTTNKITVKNFFLAGNNLVETFKFSTGEEITAADIFGAFGLTLPSTGSGTETGSSEVEGDTTYEYTTGALMINEVSGNDKVVFKNGITFSQIGNYLNMSGNDLILKLDGSNTNKVTVKDFFLGGDYVVETFAFETGGQITASQIFGAFGLTMPAATSLASVESFSFDEESNMSSDEVNQDFGTNSPLNAEDIVQSVITGDAGDNLFISDSAVSELFILNDGQDIIKLMQNTSSVTAVDYVNDFKISEDQLDLSEFLDNSQVNSSNLDEFLTISYDENLKTNTISVTGDASGNSQEILVLTNQAEFLSVQDLLLNQSIVY